MPTTRRLTFLGPVGPPVTGASLVTRRVLDRVRDALASDPSLAQVVDYGRPESAGFLAKVRCRSTASLRAAVSVLLSPGVLYVSLPGGPAVLGLFPALLAARIRRATVVIHHHSFAYLDVRSRLFALCFRLAGKRSTHAVLCDRMGRQLQAQYGRTTYFVVSNLALVSLPPQTSPSQKSRASALHTLGHFSNLTVEKGLDTVLVAARELARRKVEFRLILAGPARSPEARSLIENAKVELPQVEWRGPLDESQKSAYFSELDLFLFPSRYRNEAQPMVVLEAAAYGVPSIATEVGCVSAESWVRIVSEDEELADAILAFPWEDLDRRELRETVGLEIVRSRQGLDVLVGTLTRQLGT